MNLAVILNGSFSQLILYFHISRTRLCHERHRILCVVISERCCNPRVQSFRKRMVRFESSSEENLVREKNKIRIILLENYKNFTWGIVHLFPVKIIIDQKQLENVES